MQQNTSRLESEEKELFLQRVRPRDWKNPVPRDFYDLAVIGAGPAGLAAAESAARLGFSVAIIESTHIGGNSLNVGSVPSKAIIRTAHVCNLMGSAEDFGLAMERMHRIRARISESHSVHELSSLGIDVYFGLAHFGSADIILVGDIAIRFKKAMVATGAHPWVPEIPGLSETGFYTSDTIFGMAALPKRLSVIGGGPLGCELAQAFCRLGSHVTIVQKDAKFLPREERDAAEILSRSMARDGVEIRLNTTVVGANDDDGVKILSTVSNGVEGQVGGDAILLSVGRAPSVQGLGLEAAGVAFDLEHGIKVDDYLSSTNPKVYGAGDACLSLRFTNAAQFSAHIVVQNALLNDQQKQSDAVIPWCTYCDPEIAHIGLHVWEARQQSIPIRSFTVMMHDVDRAITDDKDIGFVKIHVAQESDRILGATIVASRASELINEMAVIMNAGIGMEALASVVHTYPAQSGAILQAAQAYKKEVKGISEKTNP